MSAALWIATALLTYVTTMHPAISAGLWVIHRARAHFHRVTPELPLSDPPAWLHWTRERLNWLTPVTLVPSLGANALYQHVADVADRGWDWEEWISIGVVLAAWWAVQRWQDNRDCNCGDDRHRKKGRERERVAEVAGRLTIVPEPA